MKIRFTAAEEAFRAECAAWLNEQISGPFADIRGIVSQTFRAEQRMEWERALGRARWSVIGWPEKYGGRDASLAEQVIFAEEYARSGAPGRVGH
ncbi:MAG: acyl-CoA dehydrogenase family protein, partial [Gammaproteobacteria bacterium]